MHGNGIRESTTTTGSGNLTVAEVSGFPRFSAKYPSGADYLFPYTITNESGAPIEGGIGYLSAPNTLVRSYPMWTYSSGSYADASPSAVALPSGTKYIHCAAPWQVMRSNAMFGCQFAHATAAYRAIFNRLSTTDTAGANTWTSADRMHYWPVLLDEGAVCSGIVISGVTNAGSYGFACGLYSVRVDGRPGARLATTGKVTPVGGTAPQVISFTGGNIAIQPGPYFIGAMVTNGALTMDHEKNGPFMLGSERGMSLPMQGFTENISAGWTDVPAAAGLSIGIYPPNGGYSSHPCIALKVA